MLREFIEGFTVGFRADTAADPLDDRWWNAGLLPQVLASTGIYVSPSVALQVSCVYQAVRVIAETLASLPLKPFRELPDGSKEVLRDHYLWRGLHTKKGRPNAWQTAQQWREVMTAHSLLWGAGYSQIKSLEPLNVVPLDPDCTQVEQLKGSDRLRFKVGNEDGTQTTFVQEEVFRLDGFGVHRFMPLSVLVLAREAIGLWLAVEKFEALFFRQGARPGIFVEHPGVPNPDIVDKLTKNLQRKLGGIANMHKVVVGEKGMKLNTFGFSPKDSQMTEARDALVAEVARWFNFPLHMLRSGKEPTFASVEQFGREFIDITLRPVSSRIEGCIDRDLNSDEDVVMEHVFDGLLRGNTLERFQAHVQSRVGGWATINEIRRTENLNPVDGGDDLFVPLNSNQSGAGATDPLAPPAAAPAQKPVDEEEAVDTGEEARTPRRALLVARNAVSRVVRMEARRVVKKELAAIEREAPRQASNPKAWGEWLTAFYGEHALFVAEALELEMSLAKDYAERHREALAAQGVAVCVGWETEAVDELTALTLEESVHAA